MKEPLQCVLRAFFSVKVFMRVRVLSAHLKKEIGRVISRRVVNTSVGKFNLCSPSFLFSSPAAE